jgi:hypothetical protein
MGKVNSVERQEDNIYAEATSTLVELRERKNRASRVLFRLIQRYFIWGPIAMFGLFLFDPAWQRLYDFNPESRVNPIQLVLVVVTVVSIVKVITLGIAILKVWATFQKASRSYDRLQEILDQSRHSF